MAVLSDPLKSFKNNDLIKASRELCRQTCSKKGVPELIIRVPSLSPLPPLPCFTPKMTLKPTPHTSPPKKRTLQKSRDVVSYRVVRSGNGSLDNGDEEEDDGRGVEGRGAQEEGGWKKKAFAFLGRESMHQGTLFRFLLKQDLIFCLLSFSRTTKQFFLLPEHVK